MKLALARGKQAAELVLDAHKVSMKILPFTVSLPFSIAPHLTPSLDLTLVLLFINAVLCHTRRRMGPTPRQLR